MNKAPRFPHSAVPIATLALVFGLCSQPGFGQESRTTARTYQVYDTMEVRAVQEEALEHLAADRLAEGIVLLQKLIEQHRGEMTPPLRETQGQRAEGTVHMGAPAWARQELFALSPNGLKVYRDLYRNKSESALGRVLEHGTPSMWLEIDRRWPISIAGYRARWAVGDLAIESGRLYEGLHSWGRALASEVGRPKDVPQAEEDWTALLAELDQRIEEKSMAKDQRDRMPGIRFRVRQALDLAKSNVERHMAFGNGLQPAPFQARSFNHQESGWPKPVVLPSHTMQKRFGYQMQGAINENSLFVSTSRQLMSLGLWGGEEQWITPLSHAGWTDRQDRDGRFSDAIDWHGALYAPAVSDGVVIASLQLPFVLIPPEHFRQIQIIRVLPERRLFAFDAKTGKPLWDTAPPADWDGESGPTAQRVSVAGPPTIAGSRVLVPTVHLRGRVEFHVDCFDLYTGEHLWHSPLVTGQRELNMFSREIMEFTAPPVRVVGDRVIVATSIGSVACLDLVRGDAIWQSLYSQIEITKATYYSAGQMRAMWIHSPPVVTDELVLVAPNDSHALMCFDLEQGDFLWSMDYFEFQGNKARGRSPDFRYIVDADKDRVILGGLRVGSFIPVGGDLSKAPPSEMEWVYPTGATHRQPSLRAVATGDSILVPTENELIRVRRQSGKATSSLDWSDQVGSPLVTEVGLFTIGRDEVRAYFDWKESLAQAKRLYDENPADGDALYRLALLYQKRGISSRVANPKPDVEGARRSFQAARELLRSSLSKAAPPPHPGLRDLLYETLLEEGHTMRMSASPGRAKALYDEALALASGSLETSRALLLLSAMERGLDEVQRRQRLARLATEFPTLTLACGVVDRPNPDGSIDQLYLPIEAMTTSMPPVSENMPMGLWARMERASSLFEKPSRGQGEVPFADLYTVIRQYGDHPWFDRTAGEAAVELIREFRRSGAVRGFDAIQQKAQQALELAIERGGDQELRDVQRYFPLTDAAQSANDARVVQAAQSGDVGLLAEVVLSSTSMEFSMERANPKQREHLALLAATVGDAGGLTFRAELGKRLAKSAPRQRVALGEETGRTLEEWSMEWSAKVPVPTENPLPSFSPNLELLGDPSAIAPGPGIWVPPSLVSDTSKKEASPVRLLPWRNKQRGHTNMAAFGEDILPLWVLTEAVAVQDPLMWAVSPGRVHAPIRDGVLTVDRDTGEDLWRWNADFDHSLERIAHSQGVVVATLFRDPSSDSKSQKDLLQVGLEASSGTELWRRRVSTRSFHPRSLIGSGVLVLISTGSHSSQVFDLFSGAPGPRLNLGKLSARSVHSLWIESGRLLVPVFAKLTSPDNNHILAYDLESGQRAWRVPFGPGRELWRVLLHGSKTYLEINTHPRDKSPFMSVFELDTERGKLAEREQFRLPGPSRIIGLPKQSTETLPSPWLFARTKMPSGSFAVRAVHLREGSKWESPIDDAIAMLRPENLPTPLVSQDAAVLALPKRAKRGEVKNSSYYILAFHRDSGRPTANLLVRPAGSVKSQSDWAALGPYIVFGNRQAAQVLRNN